MAYQAIVYKVLIASPADVVNERRIIRDAVHEWNSIHSEDRGLVLSPVGWDSDSWPSMGDRPQAIINKQICDSCDLLVAVFWTRLGSPTGAAASGTVEEIERHVASGKPALIYFSSAPVRLDSVDEQQYKDLCAFREHYRQRGIIESYESISEFTDKLRRHLSKTVMTAFVGARAADLNIGLSQAPNNVPDLSDAAKQLLVEASRDKNGVVMCIRHLAGLIVSTNGRDFVEQNDPRIHAKWKEAIEQLCSQNCLEARGYKGEIFGVTAEGYRVADILSKQ